MAALLIQFQICAALGAVSSLLFWLIRGIVTPNAPILVTNVNKCHELLSSTNLEKRAVLNHRLVVAFGIENGFTTTSAHIHCRFRNEIKISLLRNNSDSARRKLVELISASIRSSLGEVTEAAHRILLVGVVRLAVFRTVLAIFFPGAPPISDADITFITSKMDSLWNDSKSPWKIFLATHFPSRSSITHDKNSLHQKLKEVFPSLNESESIKPSENPLNLLLPACMGLFRVVLHCLLEVRFRSSPTTRLEYNRLFREFLDDPSGRWYAEENGVSVQHIVAEALRLYPPTRRIYTLRKEGVVAVDIEQVHRLGKVWGEKPLNFDPKRWKREELDVVDTLEYLPFGGKVGRPAEISRCPSRTRGGPKLVAIIVGSLLDVLGDEWCLTTSGEGVNNVDLVLIPWSPNVEPLV